jgi:hypothetical protein
MDVLLQWNSSPSSYYFPARVLRGTGLHLDASDKYALTWRSTGRAGARLLSRAPWWWRAG